MGISGRIARAFQASEITPLLALLGLLLGLFAIAITPREEEPQIDVTFANVFIPYAGASAREVEHLITTPAEQILSEIDGVKHIYSASQPGLSLLSVEYEVGEDRTQAIVRLYNAIYSNQDWIPDTLGAGPVLIKPKGIDDVPIVTLTLWSDDAQTGAYELERVAHTIEAELKRVKGTRNIYTIGGPGHLARVIIDPQKAAGYNITLDDLRNALQGSNHALDAGAMVAENSEILVDAGAFLSQSNELKELIIGMHNNAPVYLRDVATIKLGADQPEQSVFMYSHQSAQEDADRQSTGQPAVTLAISKKSGTNAVKIADSLLQRLDQLRGIFIPDNVKITVTRNYGTTADAKAKKLIEKLIFATSLVIILVLIALGWREAVIVGSAVIITLAITLFASWAWGFTLNRVSLFALIFSIGILVDDAIVVVENIHRHLQLGSHTLQQAIPVAVDEVGGPTILATLTVIAALLPMAFVTGLMGPYMSPIPINASIGMLISLAIAFTVTPWLCLHFMRFSSAHTSSQSSDSRLQYLFHTLMTPFLAEQGGRRARYLLTLAVLILLAASISLAGFKLVVLKMLPFDNKSEFQVLVDMPEGSSVEKTNAVLSEMGNYLLDIAEVTHVQSYAGTAAPINFNGLVRQYYLRSEANQGDLQVNLVDKHERDRKSHRIALSVREPLQAIGKAHQANVKIVEVPPGPPVLSPLVAEIYGLDYERQIATAKKVRSVFEQTADIVDIDDSVEYPATRWLVSVDRTRAAALGVTQRAVVDTLAAALGGEDVSYLHSDYSKFAIPVRLQASTHNRADLDNLLAMKIRSQNGSLVTLSEVTRVRDLQREHAIYHKDLLPLVMVTADMAGTLDSPLYGMFELYEKLAGDNPNPLQQYFIQQPDNPYRDSLKWDGEWQITYDTFRDMGIAYSVGLLLIYLLVVAQFRSYLVPLVIMTPIPLTLIGVMPGHALLGAQFTATSMIGMIALAGIIVRNSILLVDFINETLAQGVALKEAIIQSAAVRAKPIILTGLAAMLGALFILDDPIFRGLAISLIFGILVSTLLTLLVIPLLYYAVQRRRLAS